MTLINAGLIYVSQLKTQAFRSTPGYVFVQGGKVWRFGDGTRGCLESYLRTSPPPHLPTSPPPYLLIARLVNSNNIYIASLGC